MYTQTYGYNMCLYVISKQNKYCVMFRTYTPLYLEFVWAIYTHTVYHTHIHIDRQKEVKTVSNLFILFDGKLSALRTVLCDFVYFSLVCDSVCDMGKYNFTTFVIFSCDDDDEYMLLLKIITIVVHIVIYFTLYCSTIYKNIVSHSSCVYRYMMYTDIMVYYDE